MKILILTVALLAALPAFSQHAQHGQHPQRASHANHGAAETAPDAHGHSPYRGMQHRSIKALSDQQIADLQAGKGMSLALPAELNGYPGPVHALELAEPLALSAEQIHKTQVLFEQMQAETIALGKQLIADERALDLLFSRGNADWIAVQKATTQAAQTQGALRAAHLKAHLQMMSVLSAAQTAKYNALRGYR